MFQTVKNRKPWHGGGENVESLEVLWLMPEICGNPPTTLMHQSPGQVGFEKKTTEKTLSDG